MICEIAVTSLLSSSKILLSFSLAAFAGATGNKDVRLTRVGFGIRKLTANHETVNRYIPLRPSRCLSKRILHDVRSTGVH